MTKSAGLASRSANIPSPYGHDEAKKSNTSPPGSAFDLDSMHPGVKLDDADLFLSSAFDRVSLSRGSLASFSPTSAPTADFNETMANGRTVIQQYNAFGPQGEVVRRDKAPTISSGSAATATAKKPVTGRSGWAKPVGRLLLDTV